VGWLPELLRSSPLLEPHGQARASCRCSLARYFATASSAGSTIVVQMSVGAIAGSIIAGLCLLALVTVRARLSARYAATKRRVRDSWHQASYIAPARPTRWRFANATG
jgi:hypothetical protein